MKKNVASQLIGAQMTNAADGTAFTGTATVVITVDGGTQSASGGTGPTHEGNGYHSYIPTQAETNGDIIAFTFTGAGAITTTVQVFTTFPQTVDHAASVAAILADTGTDGVVIAAAQTVATVTTLTGHTPQTGDTYALANGATGFAAIDTVVDAILVDTAEIGAAGAGLTAINLPNQTMDITGNITGNLSGSVGSVTGAVGSVTGAVGSVTGNVGGIAGTITTLDALDTAQDTQHSTTQGKVDTAQADLNIITGASGVNLLTATQASIDAIEAKVNLLPENPAKNTQFVYVIKMVDSTDHVTPKTGLTVTMTRSLDGAAFGAATGSVAEIATGHYKVTASAADMNGDVVAHRFTGAAADDLTIVIHTTA